MPLRFLRILKRLIGGKIAYQTPFGYVVFPHDVHGVYVFSLRVAKDSSSVVTCQLGDLVHGERVGYGRKKILEHFLESCSRLATELIERIIKITPTVRVRRLGSARVICLFGVEDTLGYFAPIFGAAVFCFGFKFSPSILPSTRAMHFHMHRHRQERLWELYPQHFR